MNLPDEFRNKLLCGDAKEILQTIPEESVQCVVTSPPYWGLRDYGVEGQIGLEKTPEGYVERLVAVFREVWRVLREDGTVWLNMGDSYAANRGYQVPSTKGGPKHSPAQAYQANNSVPPGLKPKDLVGIPWTVAFALRADGWYLRSDIIWAKSNPMPESVTDRPTKSHEYLFLLSKSQRYYFDQEAVREGLTESSIKRDQTPRGRKQNGGGSEISLTGIKYTTELGDMKCNPSGRNIRTVWTIATQPFPEAHFATFPEKLVEPCIKAGCPVGSIVLDPFIGSGTVAGMAALLQRDYLGIDLKFEYIEMAKARVAYMLERGFRKERRKKG